MTAQLHLTDLGFDRGSATILDGLTLTVGAGDRIGLVGPNGAGKSTLLRLAIGELIPSRGRVSLIPDAATIGLLAQELAPAPGATVLEVVADRTGVGAAQLELDAATGDLATSADGAADRYDVALDRWLRLGAADLDQRLAASFDRIGLRTSVLDQPAESLSGGEQARVGLAIILVSQFDILLLDEPTNDLDIAGLDQLETFLLSIDRPVVLVSHDRRFLDRVVSSVVELDPHTLTASVFGGGWQGYLEGREVAKRHAEQNFQNYVGERSKLSERARTERDWSVKGVTSAKKNPKDNDKIRRKVSIERTEQLAARARRTEKAIERLEVVDKPWEPWQLQFEIGQVERSGDLVSELRDAVFEQGSFRLGPVTLEINAGDRVLISGPNGAGKSTLLAGLLGERAPISGTHRLGRSVVVGRIDQQRTQFDAADTLLEGFIAATNTSATNTSATNISAADARSTLAKFGLGAEHVKRSTQELSPGERTRALLAVFAASGVNTLVLDEPTNHLDLPAIEQLEQALSKFTGTALIVSHDRAFRDAISCNRHLHVASGVVSEE